LDRVDITAEVATHGMPLGIGLSGLAGEHEQHYTPKEIARRWGTSDTKIRRLFENERGALRIGDPSRRVGRRLKRSYFTMRIPEAVAFRIHGRLTSGGRRS
jgi:hypothetical protein